MRKMTEKEHTRFIEEQLGKHNVKDAEDWHNNRTYSLLAEYNVVGIDNAFAKHPTEGIGHLGQKADGLVFMGFEWETQVDGDDYDFTDTSSDLYKLVKKGLTGPLKDVINFRDGGDPLEMVSIPATMKYHREMMQKEFFGKNLHEYISLGHGCGIHIHVSKKAFTEASLKKFMCFVNIPSNKFFIEAIGGRDIGYANSEDYDCEWCPAVDVQPKYVEADKLMGKMVLAGCGLKFNARLTATNVDREGKHAAVNTNTDYDTIEFRIFDTVTTEQKFIKNLEFTDALTRYVKGRAYNKLTPEYFVRYLLTKAEEYPYLMKEESIQQIARNLPPLPVMVKKVNKNKARKYVQDILSKTKAKVVAKKSKVA